MLRGPCHESVTCGSASADWGAIGLVESPIADARADTQIVAGSASSRLRAAYSGRSRSVEEAAIERGFGRAARSEWLMTYWSHGPGVAATCADRVAVPSRGTVNWRLMLVSSSARGSGWGFVRAGSKK